MKTKIFREVDRTNARYRLMELTIMHTDEDTAIKILSALERKVFIDGNKILEVHYKRQQEIRESIRECVETASYFKISNGNSKVVPFSQNSCYILDVDLEGDEEIDMELQCYVDTIDDETRHFCFFTVSFVMDKGEYQYHSFQDDIRGYSDERSTSEHWNSLSKIIEEQYLDNIINVVGSREFQEKYNNKK
ncbi:hypothetical protein [Priestia aryabhattai]